MSYIRFENISKSFGKNEVLKNIDLEVEKGQLVTLLGPSGCGKSTGQDNDGCSMLVIVENRNIESFF